VRWCCNWASVARMERSAIRQQRGRIFRSQIALRSIRAMARLLLLAELSFCSLINAIGLIIVINIARKCVTTSLERFRDALNGRYWILRNAQFYSRVRSRNVISKAYEDIIRKPLHSNPIANTNVARITVLTTVSDLDLLHLELSWPHFLCIFQYLLDCRAVSCFSAPHSLYPALFLLGRQNVLCCACIASRSRRLTETHRRAGQHIGYYPSHRYRCFAHLVIHRHRRETIQDSQSINHTRSRP
jgi:hypothetical protein